MPEEKGRLLKHKLEHLYEHLRWLQRPDGTSPLFGDDDGGRLLKLAPRTPNDFRDTLATGVWLFERSDWKHSAGAAPAELLWLFGLKALEHYDQLRPLPPNATARAFSLSGYFVLRSGWDRKAGYALFDCGRHGSERGPGHAHSDALSFEFAANGVTWIVDPGTFVYGADAATRDWFRSTEAHNTVVVDRQPQSQTGKPFSWLTIAESRLLEFKTNSDRAWVKGEQTGYQSLPDPVTHTRSLTLRTDKASPCLTVNDRFQAQAQHHYALRFHLTPDCLASAVDDCITAETAQGETLAITVIAAGEGKPRVKAKIENGWVSTCYGQRTAAPVAVFEVVSTGVTEITSTLVAMPSGNN